MPNQSTSEISSTTATSTNKRISDGELSVPSSHEYTLCLLGDWAHMKSTMPNSLPSPPEDKPPGPSAIHEIAADFDSSIVQVSCGSGWGCLLCEDGRAYSFGDNTYGQLGQGHDRPNVAVPIPMSTPFCLQPQRRILRLSCGSAHGGFVLDVGELYMFGCGSYGRLGAGNEDNCNVPTMLRMKWSALLTAAPGPANPRKQQNSAVIDDDEDEVKFTDVSCGDRHTLALVVRVTRKKSDSRSTTSKSKTAIISFGDGTNGRLGLGDEKDRHEGSLISTWLAASNLLGIGIAGNNGCMAPPTITAVCAGSTHNLALSATGDVFSWGNGIDGQLGHGAAASEWVPRQLEFFKTLPVTAVSCGTSHSMALSRTGIVYTWGRGTEGQLGLDFEIDSIVDVANKSVWTPHPVGIFKGSIHRVTVRTIVAKQNLSLVLDDQDRMYVWGDNTLEQLGLPTSANTELGTKFCVPRPKLVSYMDLHASKFAISSTPSSLSRVSSLREIVAASKPDPIRLGLAHVDAGDRFTMLVFTAKPGINTSSIAGGSEIREINPQTSPAVALEQTMATTSSKWNFSLSEDLPMSAIPSRQTAYYQFMANYKVYIRPTNLKAQDDDDDSEGQRSPHRRERKRSTFGRRGSLITSPGTRTPGSTDDVDIGGGGSVSYSPAHVQGFDSRLEKRRSPTKTSMANSSFVTRTLASNPRIPSPPSKEHEARSASSSTTTTGGSTSVTVKPQRPQNLYGRTLNIRRPHAQPPS